MPVYYNSKKIIPAPKVSIQKNIQRAANGDILGAVFNISVIGVILPDMGSPKSDGTWHTTSGYPANENLTSDEMLKAILRKQEAIRILFSEDGHNFEIQPWDGGPSSKCNPRVQSIEFEAGDQIAWFNRCNYTINLEADVMYGHLAVAGENADDPKVSDIEESWQLEFQEDKPQGLNGSSLFRLTHTLSAVGKKFFETDGDLSKPAWEQARDWVLSKLGFDSDKAKGTGNLNVPTGYTGYNHVRSETIDETGGKYAASETWLLSPENTLEEFNVSTKTSSDDGITTVTMEGTITGLETRNSSYSITETKWTAAEAKFAIVESALLTRAQAYSGITLNPIALTKTVGRNPVNGVITYSYDYNDRPSNCVSDGAGYVVKSEIITVTDKNPTDVFAIIPVLGRAAGPVLQDISTVSEKTRTVNIELVVSLTSSPGCNASTVYSYRPNIDSIIDGFKPSASQVFKSQDEESWTPKGGRYSRTVAWTYQ